MKLSYLVEAPDEGQTIKHILKHKLCMSERMIKKLKYSQKIFKNNLPVYVNVRVCTGDKVEAWVELDEESENVTPEAMALNILFEDESLIAINKPPQMVTHPSCNHMSGTLSNGLLYHLLKNGEMGKIRPINRLDRDTSGIVIFAKNAHIHQRCIRQMQQKVFLKEYIGVVCGILHPNIDTIRLPIERKTESIILRCVSPTGAPAVTHYEVLERLHDATLVKFTLETGKTHQIRVHCQALGHPLAGDSLYHGEVGQGFFERIGRQALHAYHTVLTHPLSHEKLDFIAPIPEDIRQLVEILR